MTDAEESRTAPAPVAVSHRGPVPASAEAATPPWQPRRER
jgi:hypothetical protein